MRATRQFSSATAHRGPRAFLAVALLACLTACGGGGGSDGGASGGNFLDPNTYSTAPGASLSTPNEISSVTQHTLALGGSTVAYTATAGHLTASDSASAPEVSFFYVAYTAGGAPAATRPVTFLFNGGPGSATVWLHLGSWAPKRIETGVPATTETAFPYVDNAESLIDTTDLVFVDAVGTGLSEAIAPNTNQAFWGVDADAAVMRDFILRYLAANGRAASPLFVYGESYGTVRAPVVARLLETGGTQVAGVILQSSILDYNSNCSIDLPSVPTVSCAGALPSYAAVGAYYGLTVPAPTDEASFLDAMRTYADGTYGPAADRWLQQADHSVPPVNGDVPTLVADTGLAAAWWDRRYDMDYDTFRHNLVAGTTLGVYDARISAPVGSALDANDEPSDTFIDAPFTAEIASVLNDLGYTNSTTYLPLSNAISYWDFSHGGRSLPDVVPDLATAISLDPSLRILSIGGFHDLITPFHQTELDLARLPAGSPVTNHFYDGGHMTYLDDRSRPLLKADLAAFYATTLGAK